MISPVLAEGYQDQNDLYAAIGNAAEERGITLETSRLRQLVSAAEYIQTFDGDPEAVTHVGFIDNFNDVSVGPAVFTERFETTAARVDFTPMIEDDESDFVVGETSARPDQATLVSLMGLRGIQNYILLVESGILEKPNILFGNTNPEMAIVAERFGLLSEEARQNPDRRDAHNKMRQSNKIEVCGSFDEISERVFSDETRKLERVLTRRLGAGPRVVGGAALIA